MDFSLTDEQKALRDLAEQILRDRCSLERLKAVEQSPERIDSELWQELARAGLLGLAVPEAFGGSSGNVIEACLVLEQQGRFLPLVPLLPHLVACLTLARFGSGPMQQRYLSAAVSGEAILTVALSEFGADPYQPVTAASHSDGQWHLFGTKVGVPWLHRAAAVLVPARTAEGRKLLFCLEPDTPGVHIERQETMNWEPHFQLELADVLADDVSLLGGRDDGDTALRYLVDRTCVGLCAIAAGACQEAVRITAQYASNRKQFDKPIAMFQAVGQRLADSYIDNEGVNLTMWQAASRLAEELPSDREVATAKYWAAEGGSRIGHAALHIHGGISIDVDYPIHRYFLWLKQIEFTLGAATPQLARLGELLAEAE